MGPGFFIFFRTCRQAGGSGYPDVPHNAVIFLHKKEEKKQQKKIRRRLRTVLPTEVKKIADVPQSNIDSITESLIKDWIPPRELAIPYEEAIERYRQYVINYIKQLEEDEIALLLILANI